MFDNVKETLHFVKYILHFLAKKFCCGIEKNPLCFAIGLLTRGYADLYQMCSVIFLLFIHSPLHEFIYPLCAVHYPVY